MIERNDDRSVDEILSAVRHRKAPYLVENAMALPSAMAEAQSRWLLAGETGDPSVVVLSAYDARLLAIVIGAIGRYPGEDGEFLRSILNCDLLERLRRLLADLGEFPCQDDPSMPPREFTTVDELRARARDVRTSPEPPAWASKAGEGPSWRRAALVLSKYLLSITSSVGES